jgi:hypothetical protein
MSGPAAPSDFSACVSKDELTNILQEQNTAQLQILRNIQTSIANLTTRVNNLEQPPEESIHGDDEDDDASNAGHDGHGGRDQRRQNHHRQGMGGNNG